MAVGGDSKFKYCRRCNSHVYMVYNEEYEEYQCLDCIEELHLQEQAEGEKRADMDFNRL